MYLGMILPGGAVETAVTPFPINQTLLLVLPLFHPNIGGFHAGRWPAGGHQWSIITPSYCPSVLCLPCWQGDPQSLGPFYWLPHDVIPVHPSRTSLGGRK